jgi:hypothetical protein
MSKSSTAVTVQPENDPVTNLITTIVGDIKNKTLNATTLMPLIVSAVVDAEKSTTLTGAQKKEAVTKALNQIIATAVTPRSNHLYKIRF